MTMIILYSILSIILAEIAFLLAYLIGGFIHFTGFSAVALIRRRHAKTVHPLIAGIICGILGGFCALSIAHLFSILSDTTGAWLSIISLILPVMGLFAQFEYQFRYASNSIRPLRNGRPTPWYGILHDAMIVVPKRGWYEYEKTLAQGAHPELVDAEGDPLGKAAYELTQSNLLLMTISSFAGLIIGLFLAHRSFVN